MKRISWLAAGGLAGYGAVRLAGADRCQRGAAATVPLLAVTPHVAAAALLGSLLLRRRGAAAAAALTGAVLAAVTAPRAIRRPQPPADGPALRVITANLLKGRASAEAVVGLVRRQGADVLFLQELTEPTVSRLQAGRADRPASARDDRLRRSQCPRPRHLCPVPADRGTGPPRAGRRGPAHGPARASRRAARRPGLRPRGPAQAAVVAGERRSVAEGTGGPAGPGRVCRGPAARAGRGLQRHRRSRVPPPGPAAGARRRRHPARSRADPHVGAGTPGQAGPAHHRPRPGRSRLRRAGGVGAPAARQ